jgi:GxxExxY protein
MDVDADHQTTGAVIGAAIAVHRELGPGLDEEAYEASLALKLHSLDIAHTCQAPLRIDYRGTSLDCGYRYDLLIDARLPIELKAVEQILPIHQAQLLTYMRLGSHPLGLLINFDVPVLKEGIQRMALTRISVARPAELQRFNLIA